MVVSAIDSAYGINGNMVRSRRSGIIVDVKVDTEYICRRYGTEERGVSVIFLDRYDRIVTTW